MQNPVVSLALYTVSSNTDSVTASPDLDGNTLFTVQDDEYEDCTFHGNVGEIEDFCTEYGLSLRLDTLNLNLDTMTVNIWEKQVTF